MQFQDRELNQEALVTYREMMQKTVTNIVSPSSHEIDVDVLAPRTIPSTEHIDVDWSRRMPGHLSIPTEPWPSSDPTQAAERRGDSHSICIFDKVDGKLLQHVDHGSGNVTLVFACLALLIDFHSPHEDFIGALTVREILFSVRLH
jgi:hypothetical protein